MSDAVLGIAQTASAVAGQAMAVSTNSKAANLEMPLIKMFLMLARIGTLHCDGCHSETLGSESYLTLTKW